jgi:hypothetical protein
MQMSKLSGCLVTILSLTALGAFAAPAAAQEVNPLVRERIMMMQHHGGRRHEQVRVQVGIHFFVPGPSNDSEEAAKIRERVRRSVYEMAGKECVLLEDTIASECRLESINVNLNRQTGQVEGFNVNGQLGFRITTK